MTMEKTARNITPTPFYALIVAGGTGSRLAADLPKQYVQVNGQPILRHTLDKFLSCPGIRGIKVVIHEDHKELFTAAIKGLENVSFTLGGSDRKHSVFNGLDSFSDLNCENIILIHDAARPLVEHQEILECVEQVKLSGAATLAAPVTSTLKRANGEYVDREGLWAVQTPQGFRYDLIMQAHEQADKNASYTDDSAMVEAIGRKVALVQGSTKNIKITYPEDIEMFETALRGPVKSRTCTGQGFDVHSFDRDQPGPVRLCGIDIDHPYKLKGHSDADVALHALTDAIFGAIGEGDIGQHFPPSDMQWKGCDSAFFLEEAVKIARQKQARINNLDLTIICESPKVGPHRDAMKTRVAEICGLQEDQVNVKATTTEKLGFTGRGEGIAAQAIVTLEVSDDR